MPNVEAVSIDGSLYSMRLIGPKASVWPTTPNAPVVVLARTDMVARPLPMNQSPSSPDFVSGSWTGRLGDNGEATLTFPNAVSSDGVPWRQRFDPTGHLQFVEIYRNRELDFVGVIDQIPTVDQTQVQVHCSDGWFLLKKAYERDWTVVASPRDVIERATQVWVPTTVDNFPAGSLNAQWTTVTASGGTVTVGTSGGVTIEVTTSVGSAASITATSSIASTSTWRATTSLQSVSLPSGTGNVIRFLVTESSGDIYEIQLGPPGTALLIGPTGSATEAHLAIAVAPAYSLLIESDGEWIWGFVNGQLIGCFRRHSVSTTSLATEIGLLGGGSTATIAVASGVLTESLQPFLMRGSDKGDYVLPGDASTFPSGGLHARYYNDLDLQSDSNRLLKILAPNRSQAYAGSGTAEYANQQDAAISGQANPTPGATTTNWSAKWFGAIYLKLSAGNYGFEITLGTNCAARVWIGKTQFGQQLVDQWAFSGGNYTVTLSASTLSGTLGYGGGTVTRDGWYPIKIEYAVDATAAGAPGFYFTPPSSYTDPGGTALTGGTQVVVPSTSLSPLGCVDQRYQGVSHYDLAQQTVQAYDYQMSVEPQQLESGLFPGVLAPRIREGHDTDIILSPDRTARQDGEGILNYSSGLDATDFASSLQGNGAGLQNGTSGQLQALVYDPPTMLGSLFDVQQWQDFSDASFTSLLQALLNAQLGLQLEPWQLLSADPIASPRLANTWPLPGALAKMRWRPGDGMRIQARDINVWDTSPRQMLTVTPSILPNGKTGTQVQWAERPRTPARTLKRQFYTATRWQRNYQRQQVLLQSDISGFINGAYNGTAASGGFTTYFGVALLPSDQIVRAQVRIATSNGTAGLEINGTDDTTSLGGPWTGLPVIIDITSYAQTNANDGRLFCRVINKGASTASFQPQLLVAVLR